MATTETSNPGGTGIDADRLAYEAAQRQPVELSAAELSVGCVAIAVWFCLFAGGALVNTGPYRTAIQNPQGLASGLSAWLVVLAFWTVTNVGILSCVSAFLGALGRRTRFTQQTDSRRPVIDATDDDPERLATYYLSSVLRGFGVYTIILGGILVLATSALTAADQSEYLRLAPTVSIISFYAGWDPKVFSGLLGRVNAFLNTKDQPS